MSNSVSATYQPSSTVLSRLIATLDRLLAASARMAVRNGDLPYFGL